MVAVQVYLGVYCIITELISVHLNTFFDEAVNPVVVSVNCGKQGFDKECAW